MRHPHIIAVFLLLRFSTSVVADDWPQWLGPNRDSVWREKGIIEAFPEKGLRTEWRAPVALGYSGPAVADGRVFVTDYVKESGKITNNPGGRDKLTGAERVLCFDANSGDLLWKHEYDRDYQLSYPGGPRCTPTIDSGRVYTLGAEGNLICLTAAEGSVVWEKDLVKEYKTETPVWGFAAHPLVVGDLLYCVVGGEGSVAVAFDKVTGREVWRALSAPEPGYCPPTLIRHASVDQLLIWHPESLNSLNLKTGKVYWSQPLKPSYRMSVTVPRKSGDWLFASGIGTVGAMFKLTSDKPGAEVVWRGTTKTAVYNCNTTPIIEDGVIYGIHCRTGALTAVNVEDGKRLWENLKPVTNERRANHGTAFLVQHKDRYFLFNEKGELILARLSPQGYQELGRIAVLEPTNNAFGRDVVWSHPAFANQSIYARNDKELVCVSLAAEK